MARAHDAVEIALEERHAGTLHGDVGAGAHGNADVSRCQCRRVVHAVTGHGDHTTVAPETLDDLAFVLGKDLSLDVRDPELAQPPPSPWSRCRPSA